jgi:DNA-binding transcriptional LysR family regulator
MFPQVSNPLSRALPPHRLCITAGFEPRVAATVNDIGTAIGLVGIGWGITIAPELTPAGTETKLVRLPIDELDTVRHNVVIVRDREPRIAAAPPCAR